MPLTVTYFGPGIGFVTIQTNHFKIATTHEFFSPTTKVELIMFTGSLKFILNFLINFMLA